MTIPQAVYYSHMLGLGLADGFDAWLDERLEREDPLSDLVLALASCGGDRKEQIRILEEYTLSAAPDQVRIDEAFPLFLPCRARSGSAYYEFQFCRASGSAAALRKGIQPWQDDSLVVSIEDDDRFLALYGRYLNNPQSPGLRNAFDPYGINYYPRKKTEEILAQLREDRPEAYETLALWLEKASGEYNGFFFLGI